MESGRSGLPRIFSWVKDNTIRSVRIHVPGRALLKDQFGCRSRMELHCYSKTTTSNTQYDKTLNANAEEFRPKRSPAAVAEKKIIDIAGNENQ